MAAAASSAPCEHSGHCRRVQSGHRRWKQRWTTEPGRVGLPYDSLGAAGTWLRLSLAHGSRHLQRARRHRLTVRSVRLARAAATLPAYARGQTPGTSPTYCSVATTRQRTHRDYRPSCRISGSSCSFAAEASARALILVLRRLFVVHDLINTMTNSSDPNPISVPQARLPTFGVGVRVSLTSLPVRLTVRCGVRPDLRWWQGDSRRSSLSV